MSANEIEEDMIFASDESDTLFITGVEHDPETIKVINNFSFMLGDEGEEFLPSPAAGDADQLDLGSLLYFEQETFDLDQVIAASKSEYSEPSPSFQLEDMVPEIVENTVDIDKIFDSMQISAKPGFSEFDVADASFDTSQDMTLTDSSSLPASVLDSLDHSNAIDDIFKKLVLADES